MAFFESYNETASAEEQIAFVSGTSTGTWNSDGTSVDRREDWTIEFPGLGDGSAMIFNTAGAGEWQLVGSETVWERTS